MIALTSLLRTIGIISLASSSILAVDFERDLAPVLEAKCLSCHNPNKLEGDLSLASEAEVLAFEDELIVAGNAFDSLLHQIVLPFDDGEAPEMPEKGDPFTEEEAALLAEWIDSGASWPEGLVLREASKADKTWWAYQAIEEQAIPDVSGAPESWRSNPIDAFVYAGLEAKDLAPNPSADRRTLIRRATYDLTGLPPSLDEVRSFVDDRDPRAYEKLIDRLLDSPRYGERWGRHWLDVVRFGESVGFEQNWMIDDLWPFRDYVIRSFNEDKPFDAFIREHLAGDVIGEGNPEIEIGSAFLVAGPYDSVNNQDAAQIAQTRANTLDEIISATGEAFLGMTLTCARCHDHKFDPIRQTDYYQLYASFSGIRHGSVPWATREEKRDRSDRLRPLNQRRAGLEMALENLDATILERARTRLSEIERSWTRPSVDRRGTEDIFAPVLAKYVRLVCESQDLNPKSSTGFRIDEFEVWSDQTTPRNVALSSNGGIASGKARVIEDFPNAYGPQHTNDGKVGVRFIATSDKLLVELAEPTRVNRVFFSSAQGEEAPDLFKFAFVADYRIEVSLDGKSWREVAHGGNRKPVSKKYGNPARQGKDRNPSHQDHRLLQGGATESEKTEQAALKKELAEVKREISKVPGLRTAWLGKRSDEDARGPFHVFIGGNPQRIGEEVMPASLSTLDESTPSYALPSDASEAERRLELARWITHPDNPLTSRVLANRIWHYHFGTGIVDTPNDFGYMGGSPSHPELLDYLAGALKSNSWRLKDLHRQIMTSSAYRQSSKWRPDGEEVDSGSRLLWRFPPRRLSAEEIRDTILNSAGKLNTDMGGPGFRMYHYMRDNVSTYEPLDKHGSETYRRAVYHQNARASVVDLMTDFDQADCTLSTPRRFQTTTPLQALTMLNHSFTVDMAETLAERIRSAVGERPDEQISEAFRLAYQRLPDSEELARSLKVSETHGLRALCRAILNSSELIYLD